MREELFTELTRQVSSQLSARRGSIFHTRGEEATTQLLSRLSAGLRKDLLAGGSESLRTELRTAVAALSSEPLSYRDLRSFTTTLRTTLLALIEQESDLPRTALRKAEDWCHELTLQCGLLLITWREEIIERQANQLESKLAEQRQLSIPIAPIYEGVLAVPLVGSIDAYRSQILTEKVLNEISAARAKIVLLDISGVPVFDQDVARHLLKITSATRLLGTELVLVGISPETTKVIIALDVDLRGLVTLRNLQDGLSYALMRLGRSIVATRPAARPTAAGRPSAQSAPSAISTPQISASVPAKP